MKTPAALKFIQTRLTNTSPRTRSYALTGLYSLIFAALVAAFVLFSPLTSEKVGGAGSAALPDMQQSYQNLKNSAQTALDALAQNPPRLSSADPFAGDTWHAVTPSWPGTLRFDAGTHAVRLEPLGSEPIDATYSFEEEQRRTELGVEIREGTLTMRNAAGQVSLSRYRIEDSKHLELQFFAGQRPETYVKFTEAEAEQEKARIRAQVNAGTLEVPGLPAQTPVSLP